MPQLLCDAPSTRVWYRLQMQNSRLSMLDMSKARQRMLRSAQASHPLECQLQICQRGGQNNVRLATSGHTLRVDEVPSSQVAWQLRRTERDMTRAPAGGMKASGILNTLPPRPPSFFHFDPPNLWLNRSAMSLASSMCCLWSSPVQITRV